jgi:hypothetical protein
MYKDILQSIAGIEIFPVVSLCLFVAVFAVVLVWTSRLDRAWLVRNAGLPLDGDPRPEAGDETHSTGGAQ